ncbi:MAG: hypothetical protein M3N93_09595 [Acidobacteriota bacterium]|nr:hypothetical protein [Acidobacteriota bacterium]
MARRWGKLSTELIPSNPIGLSTTGILLLTLAVFLTVFQWSGMYLAPLLRRLAHRPMLCMAALAAAPICLRLVLLSHHPVPVPAVYDEFSHLLVADTLRHFRFANPPHAQPQFFETFFALQRPTYSSIYPIGQGLTLAFGWLIFGTPWAGVLMSTAAFCGLCYWMLRGWTTPVWALLGGIFAVLEFGPLNPWTNSYWGGAYSAVAGCLVFGALPRLRRTHSLRYGALLGAGLALHLLSRPFESVFLLLSAILFLLPDWRGMMKPGLIAALVCLPAVATTMVQNRQVTGDWLKLPYALSQYRYGVPASLTFQPRPVPHGALTREQDLDYKMQRAFFNTREFDTAQSYFQRLVYRIRYYRFFLYPPLYIAILIFVIGIRSWPDAWIALTLVGFALGTNFYPLFLTHYIASLTCVFVLVSVEGLRGLSRMRGGAAAARAVVGLCCAQFVLLYGAYASGAERTAERRRDVARRLDAVPGKLLVLVRYWPQHIFQDEWVYNAADIDGSRIVWARDLGDEEDRKLLAYYPDRRVLMLEPDARPPRVGDYRPEPLKPVETAPKNKAPQMVLEQVR